MSARRTARTSRSPRTVEDAPTLPHSVEAEQAVIGGLLLEASAWDQVADVINEKDFCRPDHRLIFGAIGALVRIGRPCDVVTVSDQLERMGKLDVVGGLAYLSTLARDTPTAANVRAYADIVRERAARRRCIEAARALGERAADGATAADLAADLEREAATLRRVSPKAGTSRFQRLEFGEMRAHLTDGYVVKGLIAPNTLVLVVGGSGSGKTFFTTDLSVHIAAQRPWRGRKVRGGLVVYVALEGAASAENRFAALRDEAEIPKGIPLVQTPVPLNLRDTSDVADLISFVRDNESTYGEKCVAIFIDTLSRAMAGGDENAPDDMGALIGGADAVRIATGAAIVLIHHVGKDMERGARGHSSLRAALDTEIEVSVTAEGQRAAKVTKQRDLPGGDEFAYRLRQVILGRDEDGDAVTTCVVEPVDSPQPAQPAKEIAGSEDTLALSRRRMKRGIRDGDSFSF